MPATPRLFSCCFQPAARCVLQVRPALGNCQGGSLQSTGMQQGKPHLKVTIPALCLKHANPSPASQEICLPAGLLNLFTICTCLTSQSCWPCLHAEPKFPTG